MVWTPQYLVCPSIPVSVHWLEKQGRRLARRILSLPPFDRGNFLKPCLASRPGLVSGSHAFPLDLLVRILAAAKTFADSAMTSGATSVLFVATISSSGGEHSHAHSKASKRSTAYTQTQIATGGFGLNNLTASFGFTMGANESCDLKSGKGREKSREMMSITETSQKQRKGIGKGRTKMGAVR